MSEPVNNFDVLKEIGRRNGMLFLAPLSNVLRLNKVKAGTQLTMGVPDSLFLGLANNRYVGGLILADKEEFERVKQELAGAADPAIQSPGSPQASDPGAQGGQ